VWRNGDKGWEYAWIAVCTSPTSRTISSTKVQQSIFKGTGLVDETCYIYVNRALIEAERVVGGRRSNGTGHLKRCWGTAKEKALGLLSRSETAQPVVQLELKIGA